MTWPALVLWALMLAAAASRGPALLYLFSISGAFGTLQMVPVGGATFLPQSVCAAILVIKVFLQPGNAARGIAVAADPLRLGLLAAFLAFSLATAVFLPAIYEGRIELFSVSGLLTGTSLVKPSAGNLTQSCYMVLSVATAIAFAVVGSRSDFRQHFLMAALLGGLTVIATGLVDLSAYALGLSAWLDPFRNATYILLTDAETLGTKRVVGLTSEASSYGWLCVSSVSLLAFLRPCFSLALRSTIVPLTIAALLVMAFLSTSSSAYIGLAALVAAFTANAFIRFMASDAPARDGLRLEIVAALAASFALLSVYVLSPESLAPSAALIDATIFQKTTSASFVERSTWTEFGWRALLDTGGVGVGLGSLRVSNWAVSILGSTGIAGAALLFGFILRVLAFTARPRSAQGREWQRGLRFALLPGLVMACLSGTMPDMGAPVAAILGLLAVATPRARRLPRVQAPQPVAA